MIREATKTCSKCGETKPVTAFPPRYGWCTECKRAYDREYKRRRRGSAPKRRLDYDRIAEQLRADLTYRDIADEHACSEPAVHKIAKLYGLLRGPRGPRKRAKAQLPASVVGSGRNDGNPRAHREQQLKVRRQTSPNMEKPQTIAYAVERYGKSGPSAGDVLDALEPDIRKWCGMARRVLDTCQR